MLLDRAQGSVLGESSPRSEPPPGGVFRGSCKAPAACQGLPLGSGAPFSGSARRAGPFSASLGWGIPVAAFTRKATRWQICVGIGVTIILGAGILFLTCSPSHSLSYSYLQLSDSILGLPQSFVRGYLDGRPIARYDSLTRKMEPLVPWVEDVEEEPFLKPEWVFRADLGKISKLRHKAGGLHTWQAILGCELREDGSTGGFLHYGYDGMDFLSFNKETLRWVAAQPPAEKVKEEWDDHPEWSERNKIFLEETCIEWLRKYQSYLKEALQRIEPPVGKVAHKTISDKVEVLICQAFGFYPKEIQATWTRDGEVCTYETFQRNVAPNSDGTYYVWLSIEIDPKERDHFRCHLEHGGLQEPLVLAWEEETATRWWRICVGIVAALILGAAICWWWRCRKAFRQEVTAYPGHVSLEMRPVLPNTEDGVQT